MVLSNWLVKMAVFMKAIGRMTRETVKGLIRGPLATFIKAIGRMTRKMVKALCAMQMDVSRIMAHEKRASL
jgi:hypothetical protein